MEAPKTREYFLDYSKSIILLGMMMVHILEEWPTAATQTDAVFFLLFSLGLLFGASAFMLSMGWTFNYARNLTPRTLARRGLGLLGMAYVLNVCRGFTYLFSGDMYTILFELLVPDIMQFAGLAMLVFAAAMAARIKVWVLPAAAIVLTAVGYYCGPYLPLTGDVERAPLGIAAAKYLLGTTYYTGYYFSFFPLLNWLVFPAVGYWVGGMYLRAKQQGRDRAFMQRACVIGYAIFAVLFVADHFWDNLLVGLVSYDTFLQLGHNACVDFIYDVPPLDAVFTSAFIVATFAALKLIIDAVKRCRPGETRLDRYAAAFSRNINNVYIIQWLIILNFAYPLKALNAELDTLGVWLSWLAVTAATIALTYLWDKHQRKKRPQKLA
ncbi:MAG: hypothetical protein HUK14_03645 [Muribaculaceae bacterium]|nr:hypothetical protein [Muribaculaceae bacterium]